MSKAFKKNYHIAESVSLGAVERKIREYPKHYPTPKYLTFMKEALESGWEVKIYVANKVSKYVFIDINEHRFKVRFSNHMPLYHKEIENDCDWYVGVSHTNVIRTDELINLLKHKYAL